MQWASQNVVDLLMSHSHHMVDSPITWNKMVALNLRCAKY